MYHKAFSFSYLPVLSSTKRPLPLKKQPLKMYLAGTVPIIVALTHVLVTTLHPCPFRVTLALFTTGEVEMSNGALVALLTGVASTTETLPSRYVTVFAIRAFA